MTIGSLEGITSGQVFDDRQALYDSGIHRALQAGIVGKQAEGAESIVLSGGYMDDEDHGDVIIYTGSGGQNPQTKRQERDQEFTLKNRALVQSCLNGLPVRVIRGAEHRGAYSPSAGYRYDGLFRVESYWHQTGGEGFLMCRFRLVAFDAPGALPLDSPKDNEVAARRVQVTVQRVVRDTALGRTVKELHNYACQVCGERLDCVGGPYAEAAHIRPLGTPHNGPDELSNLLCLCPNHHVMLDRGAIHIDDSFVVQPLGTSLTLSQRHKISLDHIRYLRSIWR